MHWCSLQIFGQNDGKYRPPAVTIPVQKVKLTESRYNPNNDGRYKPINDGR